LWMIVNQRSSVYGYSINTSMTIAMEVLIILPDIAVFQPISCFLKPDTDFGCEGVVGREEKVFIHKFSQKRK